jgi:hypothetical protein
LSTEGPVCLWGVDFSSAPTTRKPITLARGRLERGVLRLDGVDRLPTMAAFEAALHAPGPWLGAFDFPFGLPRAFVQSQQLGDTTEAVIGEVHRRCPTRMALRAWIDAWAATQPAGQRLLHRACDRLHSGLSSTSPLQTRYVPVAFMYYEGVRRLVAAGVSLPGLHEADPSRRALEGYPGLLAHELIGRRSYKNSDDADRLIARKDLLDRLEQGRTQLGLRVRLGHAQRERLVDDASGDELDAVLCLLQAAWASLQPALGQPALLDGVEGWITSGGLGLPGPAGSADPGPRDRSAGPPANAPGRRRAVPRPTGKQRQGV